MRISTQTDLMEKYLSKEEIVKMLKDAGFTAIDWPFFEMLHGEGVWCTDEWESAAKALRAVGDEAGIIFNQAHAPFPTSRGTEEFDGPMLERIKRSIRVAAILGVKNIVVHPMTHLHYQEAGNKEKLFEMNVAMYKSLMPLCEELGICVCTENMWTRDKNRGYIIDSVCAQPAEFAAMIDAVDSPYLKGCLDVGHCALVGIDPCEAIRVLGHDRLKALHVHDVDYLSDCHTLPFMEKLDFESICKALGEIDYTGDLTLEANNFIRSFPKALLPEACRLMAKTAGYLAERIDHYRVK